MYLVLTDKSFYYDRADLSALPQSFTITIILMMIILLLILIITALKPRVVGPDDGFPAKHRPVNQAEWDLRGEGGIIKSVNIGVDVHIGVDLGGNAHADIGVDVDRPADQAEWTCGETVG